MIIQYAVDEDRVAAELIRNQIGGRIVKSTSYNALYPIPYEDIIVVSGQIANPSFKRLVDTGVLSEITYSSKGTGFVQVSNYYSDYKIYGVAGWNRGDTIAAAVYIIKNGLPTSTISTTGFETFHLVQTGVTTNTYLVDAMRTNINQIISNYQAQLDSENPGHYTVHWGGVTYIDEDNGYRLEFLIETHSTLGWLTVVGILTGVLLAIVGLPLIGALVALGFLVVDLFTSGSQMPPPRSERIESYINQGYDLQDAKTMAEQDDKLYLDSLKEQPSLGATITNVFKYVMIIGAIGAGVYLVSTFVPLFTKKK